MSSLHDNSSPRWGALLYPCAAMLFCAATVSVAADPIDPVLSNPTAPAIPTIPSTRDIARPQPPASPPKGPVHPGRAAPGEAETEMDQRMRDLARRMAEVKPGKPSAERMTESKSLAAAGSPTTKAIDDETSQLVEARAAESNKQRLADPDDARPLGTRRLSPPAAPLPPASESSSSVLTMLTALGVVIGLIFLLRAGLRHMVGGAAAANGAAVVQVLSRTSVAPRSHVVLLRVAGRILVVSDSPAGLRTLSQIDSPEEVADILTTVSSTKTASAAAGFRQMLASLGSSYDSKASPAEAGTDQDEFRIDRARDGVSGLLGKLRNLTGKGGGE